MSDNFAYDFVSVIVGCDISNENAIFNNYLRFENKYKEKFTVDELKSEIIKQNQIKRIGIKDAYEVDSKNSVGIRIADMLAGLVSKFLKNIVSDLKYTSHEEAKKLKLLSNDWFNIDENKLKLYKMFKQIIVNQNDAWYKSFSGNYADSFLYFICLLNYFSGFKNIQDYKEKTVEEHKLLLNNLSVANLNDYFTRMHSKLPIEPISPNDKEFYYNQRGAKCYFDYKRQGYLDIPKLKPNKERGAIYQVLSVGFFGKNEQPCVTIYKDEQAQCLLLPKELSDWAFDMVAFSNIGGNFFPSDVEFGYINGRYYAEIL